MMDDAFVDWINELLTKNGIQDTEKLTPDMITMEIKDTKATIENERLAALGTPATGGAAMHYGNIETLKAYMLFLEKLLPETHTLEFILGVYEDPDELPKRVIFLAPENLDAAAVREKIISARDKVLEESPDLCIEESFERVMDEASALIGPHSRWRFEMLKSLHGKENLWEMKKWV